MPTGTGKTGVIAGVIESGRQHRHWLVLVPRLSLVRQVRRALDEGLWRQLRLTRPQQFPATRELPVASRVDELSATSTPTVFIGTFQKALSIDTELKDDSARRAECFGRFNAALVDEGHYEPSHEWSGAVRRLGLPTVLFTATPYRNDELHFEVDPAHRFWYHHHQAVADGRLREPRFVNLADGSTEQFVEETIAFVSGKRLSAARVIIRCATANAIRACVSALHRHGKSAIGIHERFANSGDEYLMDQVPAPEDSQAQYWVHQYKLLEGIDDPTFRVLAFHDPLNNDRAVVQQIGRVLRRPTPTPKTAWVLSRHSFDVSQIWNRYLYFDRHSGEATATTPDFTQCLLDAQPVSAYYDQQFRAPIDLGSPDLWRQFAYRPAARIYRWPPPRHMSSADLGAAVLHEYKLSGLTVQAPMFPDPQTVVIGFVGISNSDVLLSGLFLEGDLGFTVIRLTKSRLFVFDTHNHIPDVIVSELRLTQETRPVLSLLLDRDTRLTSVALDNTDIGRRAIRSRTLRAASIEDVAPELTDYAYVCNVAEGYTTNSVLGSRTRRYLGISRSRIRDGRGTRLTFERYRDWVDAIDAVLDDTNAMASATLNRYADAISAPSDPTPRHLLLDVDTTDFTRTDASGSTEALHLDGIATEVIDGTLTLQVCGAPLHATLRWDSTAGRYRFESSALKRRDFREPTGRELITVINSEQLVRVVPQTPGSIYVHGQFIAVPDPHTSGAGLRLVNLLTGMTELADVTAEKSAPVGDGWASDCVFGVIDKLAGGQGQRTEIAEMSVYFDRIETLLCTDLGTEPCDFIAMQPDRIAFIHAKYGDGARRSAKVFHEVVSQAIKNVAYLLPSTQSQPPLDYWDKPWPAANNQRPTLNRLRTANERNPQVIWDPAREIITNPSAQREVWIVLGAGMSVNTVRAEIARPQPADEIIQIYALLQTAWSTVAQCGAQLRIFCSP